MFPIGSTAITLSVGLAVGVGVRVPPVLWPRSAASPRCVLQASPGFPFIRTPHEPQIACWHEQRMPIEPSVSSLTLRIASSTDCFGPISTVWSSQYAASPDCGS